MFMSLAYGGRKKEDGYRNVAIPFITFGWAFVVGYSRPYLGKHYPGDLIGGALFGAVIGLIIWLLCRPIEKKLEEGETK